VAQTGGTTSWINVDFTSNRLANENYTVSYNAGNYTVTRVSDGVSAAFAAGAEVTLAGMPQGFSIAAGTPAPANGNTWQLNFQDYARTMSAQLTNGEKIAAASQGSIITAAATGNTGAATISGAQVTNQAVLSLTGQASLTYNAGQYVVTGAVPAVANIAYTGPGAQAISFNGITFTITGAPNNNDVFTVSTGPGDNGNAVALAALQTTSILDNGSTTFSGAYTQLVSFVASLASEADLDSKAFATLTDQAEVAQQSLSGVNLDEEAVNLIRYQQAYQAAAKAISVANTLFDEILAVVR